MSRGMAFKIYVLALSTFALASFLLLHFAMIWAYGKFYIYESNMLILTLETTMMVAILSFSIFCLAEQLHKNK